MFTIKMTKLKLSNYRYVMRRQGSMNKMIILGIIENSKKRRRPNMKWINSIQEAIGMGL